MAKYPETKSVQDLGRVDTAAHTGAVDSVTTAMGYAKQNVTNTESIITLLGATSSDFRYCQSESVVVLEDGTYKFAVYISDVNNGAIASADIDITGITATVKKSTGGGAFSADGLTAISFAKSNGVVYANYQFKDAEWANDDVYQIAISGVEATIGEDTITIPDYSWTNFVTDDDDIASIRDTLGELDDAAAEGAVTDADTLMAYAKQLVTAIQLIPTTMVGTDDAALASVVGALDDALAEGAVTEVDTIMAYVKQLVTAIQLIPTTMVGTDDAALASVLGALDDVAAEGAVTDADTAMAYIKQLITAIQLIPTTMVGTDDAALASVVGALDDAAAEGAVTEADTLMSYAKQLVTAIQLIPTTMVGTDDAALASVLGALDDVAAEGAATDADTAIQYLKQLVTIVLNGTDGFSALKALIDAIPTTMVGTDNAALASVLGALDDAAASGAVTDADTAIAYLKQIVNYNEAGTCVRGVPQATGTLAYANVAQADDTGDGLTPATAKKTINAAIDVAGAGGVVISKAGTYVENVDLDETAIEFWPEIGTVIAPTSGTPLTVSANFSKVWCTGGALKIIPAANETGVAVTGQFCYLSDIRVTAASTADIGFYVGSAADNTEGDGSVLTDCRCSAPLIAAFKIQADKVRLNTCCTGGEPGDSSIGFWVLPDASGVQDKLRLRDCGSQGHETAGYQIDSGCANGAIEGSYSGGGDGRWIDNGTNFTWPHFAFDDEVVKVNTLSVAGGGGTSSYNLFKVTGAVKVSNIYADVDTALTGTNTDCFLELYSVNGTVDISKSDDGVTLGTLGVGSIIMRLDKEDKVLVVGDVSSGPALIDQTDIKEEGFRVIQDHTGGSGVDTYIRFVHTCADTGTGVLHWHCKWKPVDESGFLEAV